jgi:hypothetical protein
VIASSFVVLLVLLPLMDPSLVPLLLSEEAVDLCDWTAGLTSPSLPGRCILLVLEQVDGVLIEVVVEVEEGAMTVSKRREGTLGVMGARKE